MLGSLFFFRIQSPIIGFCSPLSIHRLINSTERMLCLFIYPFRPKSTALFATDGYGGWILRCEHLWRTEQPLEFRHRRNERRLDMGVPLHDRSACAHRGHRCIHALLRVEACSRCFRPGSCLCCALSCLLLSESTFLFLPSFLPSLTIIFVPELTTINRGLEKCTGTGCTAMRKLCKQVSRWPIPPPWRRSRAFERYSCTEPSKLKSCATELSSGSILC